MTEAEKEAREALIERVAKALEDDGWLGHPDELVTADLRIIAEVAVVVFEQASRAPQPTDDDREALANLIPLGFTERDPVRNVYEAADRILAAGFRRRAPAEPAVTDEMVERAAKAWASGSPTPNNWENMAPRLQDITKGRMRTALEAALSTERGEPRGPEPVRFDPPLTRAIAEAARDGSVVEVPESPDQDQPDRSET